MTEHNPTIEAIRSRRSIRSYRPDRVPREALEIIVDCGRLAPSAMNRQTWEFVVVTESDVLGRIAELAPNNGPFIKDAPACIVVSGHPSNRSVYLDGAAAVENMLLAIHALGYASCWVQGMETPYGPPILELLGIPSEQVLVAMVPVGLPAVEIGGPAKRSLRDVLHWERY